MPRLDPTMEILSDTDSDDCQLYSNAAKNIAKKKEVLEAKLKEYEKVLNLVNPEDNTYQQLLDEDCDLSIVNVTSSKGKLHNRAEANYVSEIPSESSSDSEDNLSLTELLLRYQNERKGGKKRPSVQKRKSRKRPNSPPKKRTTRTARRAEPNENILGTIILDDDSGYSYTNTGPIDFNKPSRCKSKVAILNTSDISFSSLANIETGENESFESESTTVTIEWKGQEKTTRKVYDLRRYQKFERVFEDLAKLENIPLSRVLLMHKFNTLRPSDTPSSRNFKHYVALTGCISKVDIDFNKIVDISDEFATNVQSEGNTLTVKLQQETHTFSLSIMTHQKMSVLYEKCCEELKCSESKLKITFDGETVDPSESVADLDLEGGEIFHVYLKK